MPGHGHILPQMNTGGDCAAIDVIPFDAQIGLPPGSRRTSRLRAHIGTIFAARFRGSALTQRWLAWRPRWV